MRARCYVRVSTDEQAREGYSLSAQEERCRQFIQSQGWEFAGVYKDDGYSAKNLDRPDMQRAIRDVKDKDKDFDVLVVYRLDRLVRSVMDLHFLLDLFDKYNVKFKSVTEVFDTTSAMGRFFITLVGAMSQWERENLAERVRMGLERRILEGKRNGSGPPYGYRLENGELVIHEEEAAMVRRIFKMYQKHGTATISRRLNKEGYRTRGGYNWQPTTVHKIVTNHVYIGKLRWNYRKHGNWVPNEEYFLVDGDHEPIISLDEFKRAQEIVEKRSKLPPRAATSDYPFSAMLVCARCGHPLTGSRRKVKNGFSHRYKCTGRFQMGVCDLPMLSERSVEDAFFDTLRWFKEKSFDEIEVPKEEPEDQYEIKRESLEQELNKIKQRKKKWHLAFAEDVISLEELKERTAEDKEREKQIKKELISLPEQSKVKHLSREEFTEAIQDIQSVWHKATRQERRELVHGLFKRILIDCPENKSEGKGPNKRFVSKFVSYEIR